MLHFASATKSQQSTIVEHILKKIDKTLINQSNFKGQTPLHVAITHLNENAVENLLAAGLCLIKTLSRFIICFYFRCGSKSC